MPHRISRGVAVRLDGVVTPALTATLAGHPVHPVLASARLLEWMEWASRRLLLPYLKPEEDAVGYAIRLRHRRPCPVGSPFWVVATLKTQRGRRVVTRVVAYSPEGLLAEGQVVQVVMPRAALTARFGPAAGQTPP